MTGDEGTVGEAFSTTLLAQMESVCDRFEDACRAGRRPRVEDFWREGEELLRELLILELIYRLRAGEDPGPDEYLARFPGREEVVRTAIAAAKQGGAPTDGPTRIDLGPGESQSDSSVAALSVLTLRPSDSDDDMSGGHHVIDALTRAGYEVTGELGRGGMGVVYEARQTALGRVVALKVLRSGLFATEDERRRFLDEAEAIARLDHPGIVPVYEVRQSRGLHFFSMKRIGGSGLDHRLRQGPLPPRDAARLVALAARAVDHAHRRGLLHRDVKPANILIDESGAPVLTDFGLARRLNHDAGSEATRTGAVLGTPGFMSPEQAGGETGSLTTATDIYGLGAVLYATLTGRSPHTGSSLAEALDHARSRPPEPPSRINREAPRDLEVICLKCLEKDPLRRYATARELADDLDRWLAGEPIQARPVSSLTRARLWARRHPLPAGLAAALVGAVIVGLAGIGWEWREANRQRLQAERLLDYLANRLLAQASTDANPQGANLTVRELLDRQAGRIGGEFQDRPEFLAPLREIIGNTYHSLGLWEPAETELRQALRLSQKLWGQSSPASIRIAARLGQVVQDAGRLEEAKSLLSGARASAVKTLGLEDPVTLEATARLGTVLHALQRPADAEPLLRQALAIRRRVLPVDHPDTLRSVHDLCRLTLDTGRLDEAEKLAHQYEYGIRCMRGPNHPDNVIALANRGLIRKLQGRPAEAEPYYQQAAAEARRILGPEHPATAAAEREYAALLRELNRPGSESAAP